MTTISVVVATIPPRWKQREAVLRQVDAQTRPADEVIVVMDEHGDGAAATRNRGIEAASSEYIAFFDDDDEMYPNHLEALEETAAETFADFIYSWHDIRPEMTNPLSVSGQDPFGRPFDDIARSTILRYGNFIPIPVLVRRSCMQEIGGFRNFHLTEWDHTRCELWDAWKRLLRAGATFAHAPHKTWCAVRDGQNTAGLHWPDHLGTTQEGYEE